MIIISAYTGIYYNVIIAWSIRYLAASFTSDLPWLGCKHNWTVNDLSCVAVFDFLDFTIVVGCFDAAKHKECQQNDTIYVLGECRRKNELLTLVNGTTMSALRIDDWHNETDDNRVSPSQLYKCVPVA